MALAGLGALAAFFTAPFADPPNADARVTISIVPPSAAKPRDKPAMTDITASDALRQLTLDARRREAQKTPQAEAAALPTDDPRWAKAEPSAAAPPSTESPQTAHPAAPDQEAAPSGNQANGAAANDTASAPADEAPMDMLPLDGPPPSTELNAPVVPSMPAPADETSTAAISPDEPAEAVKPAPEQEKAATPPSPEGAAPTSNVTVKTDVKMRSGPRDEAAVVGVVPDNAVVGLVKCESWCEIVYKGRRGFIYKGFIDGRGVPAKRTAEQAPPPAPAQPPPKPRTPKTEPPKGVDLNSVGR